MDAGRTQHRLYRSSTSSIAWPRSLRLLLRKNYRGHQGQMLTHLGESSLPGQTAIDGCSYLASQMPVRCRLTGWHLRSLAAGRRNTDIESNQHALEGREILRRSASRNQLRTLYREFLIPRHCQTWCKGRSCCHFLQQPVQQLPRV